MVIWSSRNNVIILSEFQKWNLKPVPRNMTIWYSSTLAAVLDHVRERTCVVVLLSVALHVIIFSPVFFFLFKQSVQNCFYTYFLASLTINTNFNIEMLRQYYETFVKLVFAIVRLGKEL